MPDHHHEPPTAEPTQGPAGADEAAPATAVAGDQPAAAEVAPVAAAVDPATPGELWRGLLRPRATRGEALVAVLLALLGFTAAVTIRAQRAPDGIETARSEDLVRILDDLDNRRVRLRAELDDLGQARERLSSGQDLTGAALDDAEQRAATLAVLTGTRAATGPGVVVTVTDPRGTVDAEDLVDVLQELRAAGAEVIDVNGTRLVAGSWFGGSAGALVVDGTALTQPVVFTAIGDPPTLSTALAIPGGAVDLVGTRDGASASVQRRGRIDITSLRSAAPPSQPVSRG